MTRDLGSSSNSWAAARPLFDNRIQFTDALTQIADFFGYPAVYILGRRRRGAGQRRAPDAPPYVAPPRAALESRGRGRRAAGQQVTENPDAVRSSIGAAGLWRRLSLSGAAAGAGSDRPDAERRPVDPGLIARPRKAARASRRPLPSAISRRPCWCWSGPSGWACRRPARSPAPSAGWSRRRIGGGRRPDGPGRCRGRPGEIKTLSAAFNRMTGDLEAPAGGAEDRQRRGPGRTRSSRPCCRASAPASSAWTASAGSRPSTTAPCNCWRSRMSRHHRPSLARWRPSSASWPVAPRPISRKRSTSPGEGETRRLRVRIEGGVGGEMVLTFDDITRLVTAQRNAAWRDVARRIAHEIKNPLTPIQLSAERLRRKLSRSGRGRRRGVRPLHRHHHPSGRRHRPDGRRVLVLRPHAAPRFTAEIPAELLREAVFAQRVAAPDIASNWSSPCRM
jgi:two-component system nitrogen regulation sensor histidine kinase NtrY